MKRKFSSTFPTFFFRGRFTGKESYGSSLFLTVFITCVFFFVLVFIQFGFSIMLLALSLCQKVRKKFSFIDLRGFHEILPCFLNLQVGFLIHLSLSIYVFVSIQLQHGGCYLFACFVYFAVFYSAAQNWRLGGSQIVCFFLYNGVCFAFVCSFHHL